MHSTCARQEALKDGLTRTLSDFIFKSGISTRNRKKHEHEIGQYTSMKRIQVEHMDRTGTVMYGLYREQSDKSVGWISTEMGLEQLYAHEVLIPRMVEQVLIKRRDCLQQTGHNYI